MAGGDFQLPTPAIFSSKAVSPAWGQGHDAPSSGSTPSSRSAGKLASPLADMPEEEEEAEVEESAGVEAKPCSAVSMSMTDSEDEDSNDWV